MKLLSLELVVEALPQLMCDVSKKVYLMKVNLIEMY